MVRTKSSFRYTQTVHLRRNQIRIKPNTIQKERVSLVNGMNWTNTPTTKIGTAPQHIVKKELSICQSLLCLDQVSVMMQDFRVDSPSLRKGTASKNQAISSSRRNFQSVYVSGVARYLELTQVHLNGIAFRRFLLRSSSPNSSTYSFTGTVAAHMAGSGAMYSTTWQGFA